jgi:hypothetical protein
MPFDPHSRQVVVFKNNTAIYLWIFMVIWIAMLVHFTGFVVTMPRASAFVIAVLLLFWVLGLGFTVFLLWAPRVRIAISQDGVFIHERALLWKRNRHFAAKDLSVSDIVENRDSEDGSAHYTCSLLLPNNESVILAQGKARSKVAQERTQAISALMTAERKGRWLRN